MTEPIAGSALQPASKALEKENAMLRWALAFLVFALIAGVLGFTGIAGNSMYIARILFYIFIVVFLVGLVFSLVSGKRAV